MQVTEEDLITAVEKMTTAWRPEGEWITALHLEKSFGGKLTVKDMKRLGECGEACKTIEKAAHDITAEHDIDMAEVLYMVRRKKVIDYEKKEIFGVFLCTSTLREVHHENLDALFCIRKWNQGKLD